jgi:hypothetical protein
MGVITGELVGIYVMVSNANVAGMFRGAKRDSGIIGLGDPRPCP